MYFLNFFYFIYFVILNQFKKYKSLCGPTYFKIYIYIYMYIYIKGLLYLHWWLPDLDSQEGEKRNISTLGDLSSKYLYHSILWVTSQGKITSNQNSAGFHLTMVLYKLESMFSCWHCYILHKTEIIFGLIVTLLTYAFRVIVSHTIAGFRFTLQDLLCFGFRVFPSLRQVTLPWLESSVYPAVVILDKTYYKTRIIEI